MDQAKTNKIIFNNIKRIDKDVDYLFKKCPKEFNNVDKALRAVDGRARSAKLMSSKAWALAATGIIFGIGIQFYNDVRLHRMSVEIEKLNEAIAKMESEEEVNE